MSTIRRDVTTGGNARFQSLLPPLLSMLEFTTYGILNVSRSRQPTRLQETHQGATERGNWTLLVVHALIELFVTIRGVSGRLNLPLTVF